MCSFQIVDMCAARNLFVKVNSNSWVGWHQRRSMIWQYFNNGISWLRIFLNCYAKIWKILSSVQTCWYWSSQLVNVKMPSQRFHVNADPWAFIPSFVESKIKEGMTNYQNQQRSHAPAQRSEDSRNIQKVRWTQKNVMYKWNTPSS